MKRIRRPWPFVDEPAVGDVLYCLHCGGSFQYGDELVDEQGLLECPTEGCDGGPLDWSPTPWECLRPA